MMMMKMIMKPTNVTTRKPTWAPSDGRERAMLVVETIHGVGLENPSDAQNNGTNLVLKGES